MPASNMETCFHYSATVSADRTAPWDRCAHPESLRMRLRSLHCRFFRSNRFAPTRGNGVVGINWSLVRGRPGLVGRRGRGSILMLLEAKLLSDAETTEDQIQDVVGGGGAGDFIECFQCVVQVKQDHLMGDAVLGSTSRRL